MGGVVGFARQPIPRIQPLSRANRASDCPSVSDFLEAQDQPRPALAVGRRDDFGRHTPRGVGEERSNMKRIWLSSWIAGMVALAGVWWHRRLRPGNDDPAWQGVVLGELPRRRQSAGKLDGERPKPSLARLGQRFSRTDPR